MSRRIDTSKPLTQDDVQYLEDRAQVKQLAHLRANGMLPAESARALELREAQAAAAPGGSSMGVGLAGPPPPDDDPEADWLEAWTRPQLREELAKAKYVLASPEVLASDNKAELKEALYDALEALESESEEDQSEEDATKSTGKASVQTKSTKSSLSKEAPKK